MIERHPSRPPSHYAKRHGCPGYVHWPAVWHRELDYESHHQERARSQSCRQPENEEDGKENFGGTDKERRRLRRWKRVRAARQMQLELCAEKENRSVVQLQETVPFVDAGSPEWSREPDAQGKLGERRRRDQGNTGVHPSNEPTDRLPSHQLSSQRAVVNTPASSNPPMLAARSNDALSESAAAAATPGDSPALSDLRESPPRGVRAGARAQNRSATSAGRNTLAGLAASLEMPPPARW